MATATAAAAESPRPPEVGDEAHSGGEEERPRDDDDDRPRDDRHLDDVRSDRSVDSEYTYETVEDSDDEEDGGRGKGSKAAGGGGTGGGGWFGFLRRGRRRGGGKGEEDDEEERSEGEEEEISEEESEVEEGEGAGATEAEATGRDDEGGDDEGEGGDASSSSDDGRHDHPLLAPSPVPSSKASLAVPTEHSAEEAALMAEAIRRVQDRIASNGGNLYGALDPADKKLVDDLRGVDDPKTIEEAAARSAEGGAGEKEAAREEPAQSRGESLPTGEEGASASRTEEEGEESEGGEEAEAEYSEDEEEDDDERPTLEERRSLLSLAAEHDRVDVLQELLGAKGGGGGGPGGGGADEDDVDARGGLRATLLAGVSYDDFARKRAPGAVGIFRPLGFLSAGVVARVTGQGAISTREEPDVYHRGFRARFRGRGGWATVGPSLARALPLAVHLSGRRFAFRRGADAVRHVARDASEASCASSLRSRVRAIFAMRIAPVRSFPRPLRPLLPFSCDRGGCASGARTFGAAHIAPRAQSTAVSPRSEPRRGPTLEEPFGGCCEEVVFLRITSPGRLSAVPGAHRVAENAEGRHESQSAPADEPFVPPPLHVAVAHGSVGAASCLLRIGADPSLRPIAPPAYLGKSASGRGGGGSPFQRTGSARSAGTEGDRNYRKYHDATAWELAFGSAVAVEDEGDGGDRDADDGDPGETEAEGGRRGWFGFGKAKQRANEPDRAEAPAEPLPGAVDGKRRRIKKRSPLNLPPSKVEGIRHAFLSEALRAIGSDEADRLTQLLDAGVEVDAEVGGKCLGEWARDMDAEGCRGALEERGAAVDGTVVGAAAEKKENLDESKADESAEADGEEGEGAVPDARSVDDSSPADPQLAPEVVDERLAGLSAADVKSLALEARHLLPQLTACRDDLAAEVRICRSLLDDADASSAGGGRGLNSASLLDLVRSLKAQRAAAEEASREWRKAWEEREDELDFFWEEVLDDRTRAELGPILARTDNEDVVATESHLVHVDSGATGGWGKLFAEADDEVRGLRTEISALAEESARLTREVGDRGMGGALGLTRSLREEVRGAEEALRAAREGEARCRRKIEIIQKRLGYLPGYDDDPERGEGYDRGQDRREDRPERRAEPRPVPGHPVSHPADRPGQSHEDTEPTSHAGGVDKEAKTGTEGPRLQEVVRLEGARERRPGPEAGRGGPSPPRAEPVSADIDREGRATPKTNGEGRPTIAVERDEVDDYGSCEIPSSNSLLDEEVSEGVKVQKSDAEEPHGSGLDVSEDDTGNVATEEAIDNSRDMVDKAESEAREAVIEERGGSPVGELRHAKPPAESSCDPSKPTLNGTDSHASARSAKPSAAIAEGASTAIVIHDPDYARAGSLSSQIWDILRMIVGLGRVVPPSRSGSYHDVSPEDNPHIMIV
ncbi:LOW QUALITY PROTEIN: hypothetical protein ACHAWF_010639 [Thalassiosira exigua]